MIYANACRLAGDRRSARFPAVLQSAANPELPENHPRINRKNIGEASPRRWSAIQVDPSAIAPRRPFTLSLLSARCALVIVEQLHAAVCSRHRVVKRTRPHTDTAHCDPTLSACICTCALTRRSAYLSTAYYVCANLPVWVFFFFSPCGFV